MAIIRFMDTAVGMKKTRLIRLFSQSLTGIKLLVDNKYFGMLVTVGEVLLKNTNRYILLSA